MTANVVLFWETDDRTSYTLLSQTCLDAWNSSRPSEGGRAYVNFQAFDARLFEGDARGFSNKPANADELSAWIAAAIEWIPILGQRMYDGAMHHQGKDPGTPTLKQWRKWREELQVVRFQKPNKKKYGDLPEEAKTLAAKAAERMMTIERKAGG